MPASSDAKPDLGIPALYSRAGAVERLKRVAVFSGAISRPASSKTSPERPDMLSGLGASPAARPHVPAGAAGTEKVAELRRR